MLKAFKYRIYPTDNQKVALAQHFGCSRFIYNWAVNKKKTLWETEKKSLSSFDLGKMLRNELTLEHEWLKDTTAHTLNVTLNNVDSAYNNFFRNVKQGKPAGYPNYKKKCNKQTCTFPDCFNLNVEKSTVRLGKCGNIVVILSRLPKGKIKSMTVSKTQAGYYFVSILCDTLEPIPPKTKVEDSNKTIGIDLGIKEFAVTSNGECFGNPKFLEKTHLRLAHAQKVLCRRQKGSHRREKQRLKVAKIHQKITFQRNHWLHNLSTYLLDNYDTICIEDLNVSGMVKNHKLARSIQSVSWSEFVRQLGYKSEWQGKNLIKIGRFVASSQLCNRCGYKNVEVKDLRVREWICPSCSILHDRDFNASINIRNIGISPPMWGVVDVEGRGYEPVEASILKTNNF